MIQHVEIARSGQSGLDDYAVDAFFAAAVGDLRAQAQTTHSLAGRRVWMINSTAQGGGVAEMLPRLIPLVRELGIEVRWAVTQTERREFFDLTKRLHNLIHGDGSGGLDLGPNDARLLEQVNRESFQALAPQLDPKDLVVVHDPQPSPLGGMIREKLGNTVLWRCHIGLDERTAATRAAWRFLAPYVQDYDRAAFSAPEYIPSYLAGRAELLHPAIDPYSHKNRELSTHALVGVLCNAGLQTAHEPIPTADFERRVQRIGPEGELGPTGEIGLLFRPIVLQVSRWDRLKGWRPLLDAFLRLKKSVRSGDGDASLEPWQRKRLALSRLVLAGPDPASIQDDPEGVAVFEELRDVYRGLGPDDQQDVALLVLPMESREENALMVNALQRCADLVVQNSLREGFGLTVTEAMWKNQAVLGSHACGIRQQIRHEVDGVLTHDAEDSGEIARHLRDLLVSPVDCRRYGRAARRRVHDQFLVFHQIARYLELLARED